jgi:iron complex transport system substrate-binding protein
VSGPRRIVCLGPEFPLILEQLGVLERVVAVSGFTREPPAARALPKVGGFATPDLERVVALGPDLALTSTDVQAAAAAELIRAGVPVVAVTPATWDEVVAGVGLIGRATGARQSAIRALQGRMRTQMAEARREARLLPRRPRVWFEEWPNPLVAGIGWIWDLVEAAGGEPVPAAQAVVRARRAQDRCLSPEAVAAGAPDLVLAAWCGRRVRLEAIRGRPGWAEVPAVRAGRVLAVPDADFLQPGPQLLRGLARLRALIREAAGPG